MTRANSTPDRTSLRAAVAATGALLVGIGILTVGDGLQGTLLPVRATREAFSTATTGVVMSAFYAGYLLGTLRAPRMVARVGHVRVFAALASLASAVALVHAVFVVPGAWIVLRLASGFCFSGLYVVAESWLNDRADNRTRGKLLSVYMVITYLGTGLGALMLNVADPGGFLLFILISVLISVSLVPLLLSAGAEPSVSAPERLGLRALGSVSPLGVFGTGVAGLTAAAFFGMGPVFAQEAGLSVAETSLFMSASVVGAVLLQWPIGHLSDLYDRRRVLTVVTVLAAALGGLMAVPNLPWPGLLAVALLFGGASFPMYALCIAHVNDFLEREQMVGASSALVLASGVGAALGPLGASLLMTAVGPAGLGWSLALAHAAVGIFALYRMTVRPAPPLPAQGPYAPAATPHVSTVSMDWSQAVRDQMEYGDDRGR